MRWIDSEGTVTEYPRDYQGHGIREQALYFESALKNGKLESEYLPLSESLAIMSAMDEMRRQIDLRYPCE